MKRLLPVLSALVLVMAGVGTAMAWVPPMLSSDCAPNANSYAWTINLAVEDDYSIDYSFASNFVPHQTIDFLTSGSHDFTTARGGPTLYVRWSSDHGSKGSASARRHALRAAERDADANPNCHSDPDANAHSDADPDPTPEQSIEGGPRRRRPSSRCRAAPELRRRACLTARCPQDRPPLRWLPSSSA